MTSPHVTILETGTRFGKAIVSIDFEAGDCVLVVDAQGYRTKRLRFHSLDEITAAYQVQLGLAATDPVASDIARALKFAGKGMPTRDYEVRGAVVGAMGVEGIEV